MAYQFVEINLDEFSNSEIIDELECRPLSAEDQRRLVSIIKGEDAQKMDLFISAKERFSLFELQEMFGEKTTVAVSPNQLSLPIK